MTCKKSFLKTSDQEDILYRVWSCSVDPKGVICIVHGLGEHSGRYTYAADILTKSGYSVIGFDLRGHGESWGRRGHIDRYDTLLRDIDLIIMKAKLLFPNKPLFLLGHSMGGNIVLNYILRQENTLKGAIVLSPWITLYKPPSKILIIAAHVLNVVCPFITVSNGINSKDLSQEKKDRNEYDKDNLNHDRISFRLFLNMYRSGKWILQNSKKLKTPLLLMHGTDDKVTSFDSSKKLASLCSNNCTFIPWYGLYHELFKESNKKEVLNTIIKWLNSF